MDSKRKKLKRKTAFVPSVVFTTAVAGVVPACVVGCSSTGSGGPSVSGCAYGNVNNCATVAAVGYVAFDAGDGGDGDATSEAQPDVATEAGDDGAGDAPVDTRPDVPFSVADSGFRGD
jgi:hypothetical protein